MVYIYGRWSPRLSAVFILFKLRAKFEEINRANIVSANNEKFEVIGKSKYKD